MEPLRAEDPRTVGPYRLTARLGAGAMGEVYLGEDRDGAWAAVKLLNAGLSRDPEYRERFRREVEAAKRVAGTHTANVVAADAEAERPWLATEHISGANLREAVIGHGPLDADRAAALGVGLAQGLAAIHRAGLIHRDLKPGNVIMAENGPRIIDFGIAKSVGEDTFTQTGTVLGTHGFMSPEQIHADTAGPASDVFALGCVLTFAAKGTGPFDASSIGAVVHRVLNEPPALEGVPDGLREVIEACLAKDPERRPGTADVIGRLIALGAPGGTRIDPLAGRFEQRGPDMYPPGRVSAPPEGAAPTVLDQPAPAPRPQLARRLLLFAGLAALGAAAVPLWRGIDGRTSDDDPTTAGSADPTDTWTPEDDLSTTETELDEPVPADLDPQAAYAVEAVHSGRVLDVTAASQENGAIVQQWDDFAAANQRWRFEPTDGGYLKIVSVATGKVLDVAEGSVDNGAPILQWDYQDGENQQWAVYAIGDGTYSIINRLSGKGLDVTDGSQDSGAPIQQWDYYGGGHQRWFLTPG